MLKRTTEEAAKYFAEQGCELLGDYIGVMSKMEYRCKCGRLSSISWNNFTKGKRCGCCCPSGRKKKYTIEEAKEIFTKNGCEFLENKYTSGKTLVKYKCSCGNISHIRFNDFLSGYRCKKCGIDKQSGKNHWAYKPYAEVKQFFEKHDCKLLTPSWDESGQAMSSLKLQYICKCGRASETTWKNFKQGKRCGYCHERGRVKKYTQEEMEQFFKDAGCKLLGEYINSATKVKFQCSCGEIDYVRWNNFRLGHRCHKCRVAKMTGAKHFAWKPNRQQVAMDKKFRKALFQIVHRCFKSMGSKKNGHSYQLLGYNTQQLQDRIKQHPNWIKVKDKKWHIDHIFPIQAFLDYKIQDLKLINCLENLRPILGKENNNKRDRYDKQDFEFWLGLKGIKI